MGIRYVNNCCDCATESYPCLGSSCSLRKAPEYYCDKCKEDYAPEKLYDNDGEMLCEHCLLDAYETVAQRIEKGQEYDTD